MPGFEPATTCIRVADQPLGYLDALVFWIGWFLSIMFYNEKKSHKRF